MLRSVAMMFAFGSVLSACASPAQQTAAASQISTTDDQFKPFRQYKTGTIQNAPFDAASHGNYEMELISQVDRATGARGVGLQFTIHYTARFERRYSEARNIKTELLPVRSIARKRYDCSKLPDTCLFLEAVIIDLQESELRNAGNDGYAIKLFPKIGEGVRLTVPKSLIASLFTAVDTGEKQVASAQRKP